MMQVGIFTGYFPYGLKETAEKIRKLNFNTVQLDLSFKDMDLTTDSITKDKCENDYTGAIWSYQVGHDPRRGLPIIRPTACSAETNRGRECPHYSTHTAQGISSCL